MNHIYPRTELAAKMVRQLLRPGVLDEALRSGVFLSAPRRTGKTTFLLHDLVPALEQNGALVIYVDLWTDLQANPADLVHTAVRQKLHELLTPGSRTLRKFTSVTGLDLGAFGFKFSFKLENLGQADGVTLAQAFREIAGQAKTDLVMIVDEVQQALTSDAGNNMLMALKSARDAINLPKDSSSRFLFIGTGSHRAQVAELAAHSNQAFNGAVSMQFPVLDREYVVFLLERLERDGIAVLPSADVANEAFDILGHKPEELLQAIRDLQAYDAASADTFLPVIARTLRFASAEIELAKVEQLGALAEAIFEWIAAADGKAKDPLAADAAAAYSTAIGREVRIEEIQPVINRLMAANAVMRQRHGVYCLSDPFVLEAWREKQKLRG